MGEAATIDSSRVAEVLALIGPAVQAAAPDEKAKERDRFAQDVVAGRWDNVAKAIATYKVG